LKEDFRYIQFDKNLGGTLLKKEDYFHLNRKEVANYEDKFIYDPQNRSFERICHELHSQLLILKRIIEQHTIRYQLKSSSFKRVYQEIIDLIPNVLSTCDLPKMKVLAKVHKNKDPDGSYKTRPIIPNCCLSDYSLSKFAGYFIARFQKHIPWVLGNSTEFRTWLLKDSRGQTASFDFTNLYGSEPVAETISIFEEAMQGFAKEGFFTKATVEDNSLLSTLLWDSSLDPITQQYLKGTIFENKNLSLLSVITYFLVSKTICYLETNDNEFTIVRTTKFLAMGSPPVAPVSNITLAWLEFKKLGLTKCTTGIKRLIDDVIIDTSIVTEQELRSVYPNYLTLNSADNSHFLDVSFLKCVNGYITWPFVKPFESIPLNIHSFHPSHTKTAAAIGELHRLLNLCSLTDMKQDWIEFWKNKYGNAGYDVDKLLKSYVNQKPRSSRLLQKRIHIESWKGFKTCSNTLLKMVIRHENSCFPKTRTLTPDYMTAWTQQNSLQSLLHNINKKPQHLEADSQLKQLFNTKKINWKHPFGGELQ